MVRWKEAWLVQNVAVGCVESQWQLWAAVPEFLVWFGSWELNLHSAAVYILVVQEDLNPR